MFAEEEAALLVVEAADRHPDDGGDARATALEAMTAARVAGEPLETVLGWAAFAGRRIIVRPGVFVPRRRTERLAGAAVAAAREVESPVVVDLCCGSGAIAAVLADQLSGAIVHAADVDPVAVACAAENLVPRGVGVHRGDLLDALPGDLRGRIDVLVANVPYVPDAALDLMPPEARLHEPAATRDGGPDGLDVLRRVARGSGSWLAPDGLLLVEVADAQLAAALDALATAGLEARADPLAAPADDADDEHDGTRVVTGRRPV
ncbi:release factor glutamine methyltransferase [Clavibacter michiganensis]|nr:release factor glutamine methyltransferase [Clavibacter michiganensis]